MATITWTEEQQPGRDCTQHGPYIVLNECMEHPETTMTATLTNGDGDELDSVVFPADADPLDPGPYQAIEDQLAARHGLTIDTISIVPCW